MILTGARHKTIRVIALGRRQINYCYRDCRRRYKAVVRNGPRHDDNKKEIKTSNGDANEEFLW